MDLKQPFSEILLQCSDKLKNLYNQIMQPQKYAPDSCSRGERDDEVIELDRSEENIESMKQQMRTTILKDLPAEKQVTMYLQHFHEKYPDDQFIVEQLNSLPDADVPDWATNFMHALTNDAPICKKPKSTWDERKRKAQVIADKLVFGNSTPELTFDIDKLEEEYMDLKNDLTTAFMRMVRGQELDVRLVNDKLCFPVEITDDLLQCLNSLQD